MTIVDLLGFAGAGAILAAFALTSSGSRRVSELTVTLLNLGGAAGLALNGAVHHAWPSTVVNAIWLVIALLALRRLVRSLRARTAERTVALAPEPVPAT